MCDSSDTPRARAEDHLECKHRPYISAQQHRHAAMFPHSETKMRTLPDVAEMSCHCILEWRRRLEPAMRVLAPAPAASLPPLHCGGALQPGTYTRARSDELQVVSCVCTVGRSRGREVYRSRPLNGQKPSREVQSQDRGLDRLPCFDQETTRAVWSGARRSRFAKKISCMPSDAVAVHCGCAEEERRGTGSMVTHFLPHDATEPRRV